MIALGSQQGLYSGKYLPPGGEGNISQCHLGEKYEKRKRKRGRRVNEKGKGERKMEKGQSK
jgi:hypothetical protein